MAISTASWLDVPARQGITDAWREEQFPGGGRFEWPYARDRQGRLIDLRQVLAADAGIADMHYLVDVEQGWYAVTDRRARVGFTLTFPTKVFPHVWLFRTFGGWRGLHTLILKPQPDTPTTWTWHGRTGRAPTWRRVRRCGRRRWQSPIQGSGVRDITADGSVVGEAG